MAISESDWKKFKALRKIALERFHLGVLSDAKSVSDNGTVHCLRSTATERSTALLGAVTRTLSKYSTDSVVHAPSAIWL